MTAAAYQNELEIQFSKLPGFLQGPLRDPFNWIDGILKDIAGNPDQLTSAGEKYAALGKQVTQLGEEQAQDARSILNGQWEGQAYDAFIAQMNQTELQIASLGQSITQTQPLLDAAAQACAQSASMIVEIVEAVISFILQDAVVSGVAAVFTFGASVAAGVAAAVAKFASACEKIGGIVERLGVVLEKVAAMLKKLEEICRTVVGKLRDLREAIATTKKTMGLKGWLTKDGARAYGSRTAINAAVRAGVGVPLVGSPFPGIVGGPLHAGEDGVKAGMDVHQAKEQE